MNNYFYVDVDDEITSVIGRLRKENSEEIFLVVPKRAIIAQSLVNLKLLGKEASKLKKKLIFVSPDSQTRKIAEKAGLSVKKYVAKPKDKPPAEPATQIPSKKRALERWEEEAASEELKKVISKPKPPAPKPTKIKAGIYSVPKTPRVPVAPPKPPVIPEPPKEPPAPIKNQVVNLKELAAQRRAKKMAAPPVRKKELPHPPPPEPKNDLVEEPALKALLTAEEEIQAQPRPRVAHSVTRPQFARANPFKIKKIEKVAPIAGPPPPPKPPPKPKPPEPPKPPPNPKPPAKPKPPEPSIPPPPPYPIPMTPTAEIPEQLERETANLTLKEKEQLRDLWMEQKGIVRGKTFQDNTNLDLNAKEAPKEELVTQGTGIFQTTHRRVIGSGKVIDLRAAKSPLAGAGELNANRIAQKRGKEIILPLLNVKLLAIFIIGISVILIILMGIILPEAKILITPQSTSDNLDFKVWASGEVAQADPGERIIPAKAAHFKVNEEKTFSTTGIKEIQENSQGQVTIYNNSDKPLSLKQNAALTDSSGNKFYTAVPVTIPAAKQSGADNGNTNTNSTSTVKAGSGSVNISAEKTDKDYNLKAGDALTIPGLADGDYAGMVTAEIAQEIKKGDKRTAKIITQEDLDNAKNDLINQAKQDSPDQIKNNLEAAAAKEVRPEDLVTEDVAFTSDKKVGQEAETFSGQVAITFFALAFSQDDLKNVAKNIIESDQQEKNGSVNINNYTLSDPRPLENKAEISANLEYRVTDQVDPNEVKKALLAKKKSEAEEYLKNRSDIAHFTLNIWPDLLGHLPVLERRINVNIQ